MGPSVASDTDELVGVGTTATHISEAFADERDRLLSLPAKAYEPTFIGATKSGKTVKMTLERKGSGTLLIVVIP